MLFTSATPSLPSSATSTSEITVSTTPSRPSSAESSSSSKKRKKSSDLNDHLTFIGSLLEKRIASQPPPVPTLVRDESDNFGVMIAAQHRMLTPAQRLNFTKGVFNAFIEASSDASSSAVLHNLDDGGHYFY